MLENNVMNNVLLKKMLVFLGILHSQLVVGFLSYEMGTVILRLDEIVLSLRDGVSLVDRNRGIYSLFFISCFQCVFLFFWNQY